MKLYDLGQRAFGENRALELRDKATVLPEDIEWHMIGRLQTNKVKYVVPHASMIQSCDRWKLAAEIQKQAVRYDKQMPVFLDFSLRVNHMPDFEDFALILEILILTYKILIGN